MQFERPNKFYKGMYAYHVLTTTDFLTKIGQITQFQVLTGRRCDFGILAKRSGMATPLLPANGRVLCVCAVSSEPVQ